MRVCWHSLHFFDERLTEDGDRVVIRTSDCWFLVFLEVIVDEAEDEGGLDGFRKRKS